MQARCGVVVGLFLASLGSVVTACAATANHPIRTFTFEERGEAVAKLYRLGLANDPGSIPVFCDALKSDDVNVRTAAIAQLVFTHDGSAVGPVIAVMKDPSTTVRRYAIACLERIGSPQAIPALREALTFVPPAPEGSDHRETRPSREAAGAPSPISKCEYFNRLAAAMALFRLGSDDGAETVLAVLKEPHENAVLQMAIRAAITMDLKQATPTLIAMARQCNSFGEDSPGFHSLRALRIIGDPAYGKEIVQLVKDKFDTPGGFVKLEGLHNLLVFGDRSDPEVGQIFERWAADPDIWSEHQALVAAGLQKFAPPGAAAVIVKNFLARTRVNGLTGETRNWTESRVFQLAAMAVADLGDESVLGDLRECYEVYSRPIDYFPLRLYLAYAMAKLGDGFGLGELQAGLHHPDAGVRRMSAKLLGMSGVQQSVDSVTAAIKKETDPTAFGVMKASLEQLGALSSEVASLPAPAEPTRPTDPNTKPRYITFTFDDCNTIEAMERYVSLMEDLARQDARWVFTMYVAPNAKDDFEYLTLLLQRGFDRGCEIENHTLHHNPEGQAMNARTEDAVRLDIGGGQNWLHSHIMGLDKIYTWKGGGGGFRRPGDPTLDRQTLSRLAQERYLPRDITYGWVGLSRFSPDLYAPPYHDMSSEPRSDWSMGELDLEYNADTVQEREDAFVSSYDAWYFRYPADQVFIIGSHDFTKSPTLMRFGHEKEWDIFSGFIKDVLLDRRDRYPQAYCMTALELTYITRLATTPSELLTRTTHIQDSAEF